MENLDNNTLFDRDLEEENEINTYEIAYLTGTHLNMIAIICLSQMPYFMKA